MKKICLIGQFPPPIHGLSKALNTIKNSKHLKNNFLISSVNISDNKKIINSISDIRKNDSDIYYFTIAHSKMGNIRDLLILKELIRKNKKIIIHYHGGYFRELFSKMSSLQKKLNLMVFKKIDIVIVLGESLKRNFTNLVSEHKIRVCENYVESKSLLDDEEFISKIDILKRKDKLDILYLSNFIKTKGYYEVLNVARRFNSSDVDFHFAGDFFSSSDKEEFLDFIKSHNINNVFYYGVVDGKEKKELIKKCDVFILPTYYHIEGQPISLIESMANGLTVITTNHAGIPDIVTTDNGYIVEPKSINDIELAIQDILSHKDKLISYGYNNRNYALQSFKEIDYIKRLETIFEEV